MPAILITSSALILLVSLLRTVLRGRVRAVTLYALWLVCALRLLLPFSFGESRLSPVNVLPPDAQEAILPAETLDTEIAAVPVRQETVIVQQTVPEGSDEPLPPAEHRTETVRLHISLRTLLRVLRWTGTAAVLLVFCVCDTRFHAALTKDARVGRENGLRVGRSPALTVPCLYGTTIWLPEGLSGDEERFALAHEAAHLRHADPVWIVLRVILVAVWWFDPLVWLAAVLSKQDAELAADESAIRALGDDARIPYSRTLLAFGAVQAQGGSFCSAAPMARRSRLSVRIRLLAGKPRRSAVLTALALLSALLLTACAFTGGVTEGIADRIDDSLLSTVAPVGGVDAPDLPAASQGTTTQFVPPPAQTGEPAGAADEGPLPPPAEGYYADLLASAQTKLNSLEVNRTSNVRLACLACNGMELEPGEEFSCNKTLGPRTEERGYKDAGIYLPNEIIDGVGGGVSQLSSTLYMAVMRADLEVTERWCHRYTAAFCPDGEDATVSYGSKDFKFRNNTGYPVRLEVTLEGSCVNVGIYGTRTQDKTVTIETEKLAPDEPYEQVTVVDPSLSHGETREANRFGRPGRSTVTYRVVTADGVTTKTLENYSTYSRLDVVTFIGP